MANNSYPMDELGNKLKVGDTLLYRLPDASALFQVVAVTPASLLQAPGGGVLPTQGTITLQAVIHIGYQVDEPRIGRTIAVRTPETSNLALVEPS